MFGCKEVTLLRQRVITAIVVIALLYAATAWLSPVMFAGFVSLAMLVALLEWSRLAGWHNPLHRGVFVLLFGCVLALSLVYVGTPAGDINLSALVALNLLALLYWVCCFQWIRQFPDSAQRWDRPGMLTVMGICSLLPVWWALVWLKTLDERGLLVFVLIALVSIADIGAYFSGRAWGKGRARLAQALSPNKSWVGFWGGMISCVSLAAVLLVIVQVNTAAMQWWLWPLLLAFAALLAAFSVLGDLFESMLKRQRGIKDSGRILPGHGGILDRVDSLLPAAPVFVLGVVLLYAGTGLLT